MGANNTKESVETIIIKTVRTTLKELEKKKYVNANQTLYQKTETLLYKYPNLKIHLNNIELDIKDIIKEGTKYKSKDIVIFSGRGSSDTEEYQSAVDVYKEGKERTQRQINRIERALKSIENDLGYEVVQLKYFQSMSFDDIARNLNIGATTAKRWRNRLVNKMSDIMWGSDVD